MSLYARALAAVQGDAKTRGAPLPVARVNQLDAQRLDSEIHELLGGELASVFEVFWPGLVERLRPELQALLRAALWRYTIWIDAPTPGCQLQNLVYSQAQYSGSRPKPLRRSQKLAALFVSAFLPWLVSRARSLAELLDRNANERHHDTERGWSLALAQWYLRASERVMAAVTVCAAANFLAFLRWGQFATVSDRLLGIRLVHIDPAAHRQVAFEYMNRVMIWNALSEFLMTIVPLVDLARVRRAITRRLFPRALLKGMDADAERACGLCGASPITIPVRSDCGHIFCYFCLASEQMERPTQLACPRCSTHITGYDYA